MIQLRYPYPSVSRGMQGSYGGNQMWASGTTMQQCGCGVVAALDLLLYLKRYHGTEVLDLAGGPISLQQYNAQLEQLRRKYFPLIPHFGINGLLLVAGLNRLLRHNGLPYRAKWVSSGKKLWARAEEMLQQDIPVILSVGPNFPAVWQKHRLGFYVREKDGAFRKTTSASAHYVTITGLDSRWVRIASWGRQYYIDRQEYEQFVGRHSNYLFSNIVYLEKQT